MMIAIDTLSADAITFRHAADAAAITAAYAIISPAADADAACCR
jgi:hypothetical protein